MTKNSVKMCFKDKLLKLIIDNMLYHYILRRNARFNTPVRCSAGLWLVRIVDIHNHLNYTLSYDLDVKCLKTT